MKFYNREKEIASLSRLKKDFRIAVVGRRRIGKTTLVEHFYKDNCITFFVSAEKSEKEIIGNWIREYPDLHLPEVNDFKSFFDFAFFHVKEKIIFIDELQNFFKVNKSFFFDLQRLIDKHKPRLIVSGSIISLMKRLIESYKSPLYGRFDFIVKLKELEFKTIYEVCNDMNQDIKKAFFLYSIFGGIPKYYELIEKIKDFNIEEFLLDSFIRYPRPLYEEVRTMLKEEFGKEYKTFFSILSAISQGKNKHSEIAGFLGKKETEITKYLALLKDDFEIIERRIPLIGSKKGIYAIKNNLIRFWFSSIWKYNELLETLQEEKVIEIFKKDIIKHASLVFEKTIIELLKSRVLLGEINFLEIGRQWGRFAGEKGKNTYEIDIAALNDKTKQIFFGECKWQDKINAMEVIEDCFKKAGYVEWNNETREESFIVFAKSFNKKISEFKGKKVYCFDLKDIEKKINKPRVNK